MESKDLRIGNLITDKWADKNSSFKVVSIASKYPIIRYGSNFSANIKNINGIPLSEEWLIKFGFIKLTLPGKSYYKSEFRIDHFPWGWGLLEHTKCKINYVHQLQNLYFALTGNELQIIAEAGKEN